MKIITPITNKTEKAYRANKTVQAQYIQSTSGTMNKNIAGVNYTIEWTAKANGNRITAKVEKPQGISDYMWYQVKGAMKAKATMEAKEIFVKNRMVRASIQKAQRQDLNWFEFASKSGADKSDENETIDDALLSDGLGAFCDAFVNYTSGQEGDKLAKWMIAICKDPKFSKVSEKLETLHNLIGEIYSEIEEIAKKDNER